MEDNCVSLSYDLTDLSVFFSTLGKRTAILEVAERDEEVKISSVSAVRLL